ncbi:TetR/AcrR family transcriptional regulator [Amycolatopsis suaedae]|uniref:TetR/AcrR family transcriptional regulator n=1 Tax=Amycolatopsis suaedae TaxID=2510978 RepID=A0A4Q7IY81_9PSEU|nr:TetR/AcrR family transcriptional regulator [Amycolatopsis suaedae]RZQ59398.1 TetR/AcrR family transcriptional regulator [Amycolatopsis suaedae]
MAGARRERDIHAATLELLTEVGYDGLTIEGVAARSGVNKTTIYRWWPSKDALLGSAMVEADVLAIRLPDTGSLRGDLESLLRQIAALLTGPDTSPVVTALLGAATHRPELGEVVRRFFADRLGRELPMFERAVRRGELRDGVDPATVMDLLAGAVWVRALLRGQPPRPAYVRETVDLVLRGCTS